MSKISLKDKFEKRTNIEVKSITKSFWGNPIGSKMLIPSPNIIQKYIDQSEFGDKLDIKTMRKD